MSIHAIEVPVSRRFATEPGSAPRHPASRRLGQAKFAMPEPPMEESSSSLPEDSYLPAQGS